MENDIRIIYIDNLITAKLENLKDIINDKRFVFINHDIKIPIRLNINNIEKIFNFSCILSSINFEKKSLENLDICYIGMKNILDLAKKFNSKVIQASSYEIQNKNSIDRISEILCYNYKLKFNLEILILRISKSYNNNMKLINSIINSMNLNISTPINIINKDLD